MTYNLLWEWPYLRTVLPAAKIGSSGVALKAQHFYSPLHRQTASWKYGISVWCLSLPTFLSSPTYQPGFKATSTASLFSYNHSLIVGFTLKAFSRPVLDPLLATSNNPVWPLLPLAVPHILFCGMRDASWFLQTWIHVLFFVLLDVWPTSSSPPCSNH